MALAWVQKVKGTTTGAASFTMSFTSPPAAGALVAVKHNAWAQQLTFSDNRGNTYANRKNLNYDTAQRWLGIDSAENVATGSPFTITVTDPAIDAGVAIASEATGAATSTATDKTNSATGTSTAPAVASGVLTQADEIVFAVAGHGSSETTITEPGTPWNLIDEEENQASFGDTNAVYQIVAATTSVTPTWALGTSLPWGAVIVTFKAAAAGGGLLRGSLVVRPKYPVLD